MTAITNTNARPDVVAREWCDVVVLRGFVAVEGVSSRDVVEEVSKVDVLNLLDGVASWVAAVEANMLDVFTSQNDTTLAAELGMGTMSEEGERAWLMSRGSRIDGIRCAVLRSVNKITLEICS